MEHEAEEIPVDAYTGYIIRLSEARTSELRREAAEYALSRVSRRNQCSRWARAVSWLVRRPQATGESAAPVLPALTVQPAPRRPAA